jgi:hypothetical protein
VGRRIASWRFDRDVPAERTPENSASGRNRLRNRDADAYGRARRADSSVQDWRCVLSGDVPFGVLCGASCYR